MRAEKNFLIDEVTGHLRKSGYVFLANFDRITVSDVGDLRDRLATEHAEFHVVKNSSLKVAARDLQLPDLNGMLTGPTAIIVGGENPSGVAKIVKKFFQVTTKLEVKGGVLGDKRVEAGDISRLADLPSLEVLRAQLLCLFNQPATSLVRVLQAVPVNVVNVLQARVRAEGGAE